jgi:hypothetical protein
LSAAGRARECSTTLRPRRMPPRARWLCRRPARNLPVGARAAEAAADGRIRRLVPRAPPGRPGPGRVRTGHIRPGRRPSFLLPDNRCAGKKYTGQVRHMPAAAFANTSGGFPRYPHRVYRQPVLLIRPSTLCQLRAILDDVTTSPACDQNSLAFTLLLSRPGAQIRPLTDRAAASTSVANLARERESQS